MVSRSLAGATGAAVLAVVLAMPASAQSIAVDRRRGEQMLDQIREDLVEHYYDPTFHGLDLDGIVDRALVDTLDEDGDAHERGLRLGDTVVEVAGYALTRVNAGTVRYLLTALRPQPQLEVTVERDGTRRTLTIPARIRKRRARLDIDNQLDRHVAEMQAMAWAARPKPKQEWLADGVLYWRLTDFFDDADTIRKQGDQLRKARHLVLDLRDNPGGSVGVLLKVAGLFLSLGAPVVTIKGRGQSDVLGIEDETHPFGGRVTVLVDARSGSSAEILARLLQMRGAAVIGDRTMGAVTGGRLLKHAAGEGDIKVLYAMIVTVSDVLMPDGSRHEGVGVQPDTLALPTPDDLEHGLDPVLAKAAALAGVTIDAQRAGHLSRQ